MTALVVVLAVLVFVLLVYVLSGLKIVRPYQRGIVERLRNHAVIIDWNALKMDAEIG